MALKDVRNVIEEMVLKLQFFQQNHKNHPGLGALTPRPLFVTHLSCISLFSTGPKLENFCVKKVLVLVQTPFLLAKSRLRFW